MAIHVAAVVLHLRGGYAHGVDTDKPLYAMTEHYRYHALAVINDVGVARLEGLDNGVELRDYRDVFVALKRYGVRRVEYRHNGVEKFRDLR